MIIEKIIGNIAQLQPKERENFHIEKIYIESEALLKRIQRLKTDHGREVGVRLPNHAELHAGDILYQDDRHLIVLDVLPEDILAIKPRTIQEMGVIAHQLGNRHLPAQFEDNEMIVQYDYLVEELLKKLAVPYERQKRKMKKAFFFYCCNNIAII